MRVAELLAALQGVDPATPVLVEYEGVYGPAAHVGVLMLRHRSDLLPHKAWGDRDDMPLHDVEADRAVLVVTLDEG